MRPALLLGLAAALAAAAVAHAQPQAAAPAPAPPTTVTVLPAPSASLNITPKRLTFDRTRRNGAVVLLNQGASPVTVDIGLVDRVMTPDGQIFAIDDPGRSDAVKAAADQLKSARDLLQVSPRRAVLAPGRPQTVRVRLSTLPEAASGEHRTHLTITTIPPRDTGVTAEQAAAPEAQSGLRFQITAIYGLSIPLIVRPGDPDVGARIEGARLDVVDAAPDGRSAPRRTPVVSLDLVRAGAGSVYGNFEVHVVGEKSGSEPIGLARGVGVYPEIARRSVRIPLSRPPAAGERLEVTFTDDDTSPGKVLAKAAL